MASDVKALIAEARKAQSVAFAENEVGYALIIRALTDALEAATVAPVDGDYHEGLEEGIKIGRAEVIRSEADVKAEALEEFAVMIRPTNPRNDWTDYAVGRGRAADQLEARAHQIREARNA